KIRSLTFVTRGQFLKRARDPYEPSVSPAITQPLSNFTPITVVVVVIGRGGSAGAKFRISLGLPVGAVINCADNTGK
ncbi:60S ribosomal protein L23, partial [Operophtera brumata]